jgi:3-methylcrotonyl-CoA carboxylase alpha subunit
MEEHLTGDVVRVAGEIVAVDIGGRRHAVRVVSDRDRTLVWCEGETFVVAPASPKGSRARASSEEGGLRAPMPGKILRTAVRAGDRVSRGSTLLILEAMKMEHEIKAPADGKIAKMPFSAGDQVEAGALLVEFTP